MNKYSSRLLPVVSIAATLIFAGCSTIFDSASEMYIDHFGSRSWARKANLGGGKVEQITERTLAKGTLLGRFNGLTQCVQTIYRMPVPNGSNTVLCEAIMPPNWNGKMLVLGCEGPGGVYPKSAPQYAKDGTMVVSCDGGMNFTRNRDGSPNAIVAGFRRPAARETFMQEAVHLCVVGGKELAKAFYGKPVEKTAFFGRESGGGQGIFLAERHPEDVDEMQLVSPVIDFWPEFIYEFNVATHVRESTGYLILKASQCDAVLKATQQASKQKQINESDFFALAARFDSAFAFSYKSDKICKMWHELFSAEQLSAALKEKVAPVAYGIDMRPLADPKVMPWRVQWFFGDNQFGHAVPLSKLQAARGLCDKLSPTGDLSAFAARGGKLEVVVERSNAFVPEIVAEEGLKRLKGIKPEIKKVDTFPHL